MQSLFPAPNPCSNIRRHEWPREKLVTHQKLLTVLVPLDQHVSTSRWKGFKLSIYPKVGLKTWQTWLTLVERYSCRMP